MATQQIYYSHSLDIDKVHLTNFYHTSNDITKAQVECDENCLFLHGPTMFLGADLIKNHTNYYIDLVFSQKKQNQEFYQLINQLDSWIIRNIYQHSDKWYNKTDFISLTQIESEYIPTIKWSLINNQASLKLAIDCQKIEFFDQTNHKIMYQQIKKNMFCVPLLQLSYIYREGDHFWAGWELLQLKVNLIDTDTDNTSIFDRCYLSDSESSEEETIPENIDFY